MTYVNGNKKQQMRDIKAEIKALPKGLQDVNTMANKCIQHLIVFKKQTPSEAEAIVLEMLKEHESYLVKKQYKQVCVSLGMILMDEPIGKFKLMDLI